MCSKVLCNRLDEAVQVVCSYLQGHASTMYSLPAKI
jgi:hypothetical protein